MNKEKLVDAIEKHNGTELYPREYLNELSEKELSKVFAAVGQNIFKGRNLAPKFSEELKFQVQEVEESGEVIGDEYQYIVSGRKCIDNSVCSYSFTGEEILDLIETKATETEKSIFGFCK